MAFKLALSFISLFISITASAALIWPTNQGPVLGSQNNGAISFPNVPYAQAPVGSLRWKAPRPPKPRTQVWNGENRQVLCAQRASFFSGIKEASEIGQAVGSEDCLYLNMWMPAGPIKKRPVFVWFYGGSNRYGYAGDELYDGAELAKSTDSIVIAVNYRLAFFGAFFNSALQTENPLDSSGNFVTLDGIQSLLWIRENISRLGGDIQRITVAGESAGCINVWGLIQSPLAKNLFQQAYCSSGIPNSFPKIAAEAESERFLIAALILKKRASDEKSAQELAQKMSASETREFLYSLSTKEILSVEPSLVPIQHIGDGIVLPIEGLIALALGNFHRVPMMVSTNFSEASYFILPLFVQLTAQEMWPIVTGKVEPRVLTEFIESNKYPAFLTASQTLTTTMTAAIDTALIPLPLYGSDIYRFRWNWSAKNEPWKSAFGASHGIDLPFLFRKTSFSERHYLNFLNASLQDPSSENLAKNFHVYLKGFLHFGNPNHFQPAIVWEKWKGQNRNEIIFTDKGPESLSETSTAKTL